MPRGGSKPGERRGGRQKGTPNKVSGELRDMILTALSKAGGVQYLVTQATQTPTAFLSLVGKVLPLQMTGEDGKPLVPAGAVFALAVTQIQDSENQT